MLKILFLLIALFTITNCSTLPTATFPTTINISPKITLPQKDPYLSDTTVSINGTDRRVDRALAKINYENKLVTLTASRDLHFLLKEILEKQMTSRGYMIGSNGGVCLQIFVNNLYADIFQGNVRYKINAQSDIDIIVTALNGNKANKNYRINHFIRGIFQANIKDISDAINNVLTDTIANMAQDAFIHNFIKQNNS